MSKETTIGQLEEVDVLNDADNLVVDQEGRQMARKASVATLATKVGELLGAGGGLGDTVRLKVLTKTEYNNLAEKDATTLYAITKDTGL